MKNDQPFTFGDYLASVDDMGLLFDPLVDILCHVEAFARDSGKQGCLIGIKGDWGSGKTSILRAVEDYFGKGRGWPAIFFEAWKYQDEHQPVLPLLVKLRDVTSGGVKGRLTKAIHLLGVAALTTGDAALKVVTNASIGEKIGFKDIEKAFQLAGKANMESWSRFENTFQALRKLAKDIAGRSKHPQPGPWKNFLEWKEGHYPSSLSIDPHLIIIVDDLDRLLPDRAVSLLESIRFFLMLPRTIVILGINDQVLSKAIEIRYRDPETNASYFSGTEFMEKLFQWSVELPSTAYQVHMDDIHFGDVKALMHGELPDETRSLVNPLDPLPHRKWIRIANRWESNLQPEVPEDAETRLKALWSAIFHECFPAAESFLRRFPLTNRDFMNQHLKPEPDAEQIVSKAVELAHADKTFFHFPERNFKTLSSVWNSLAGQSAILT
jgi:hypothetical protein